MDPIFTENASKCLMLDGFAITALEKLAEESEIVTVRQLVMMSSDEVSNKLGKRVRKHIEGVLKAYHMHFGMTLEEVQAWRPRR